MATLATVREGVEDETALQPYSMHVSQRYLELTAKKLALTRLPREVELPDGKRWEMGTPKAVLEGVLDYWEQSYDWRTQESLFNAQLPQYRTTITVPPPPRHPTPSPASRKTKHALTTSPNPTTSPNTTLASPSTSTSTPSHSLRLHFTHLPSNHPNAIPLLYIHTYPSSFLEISKTISALTDPASLPSFGPGATQAFHVVAPSIPGFAFSDASPDPEFGVRETAAMFDGLMARLGYETYVASGSGWGFAVCRALAMGFGGRCKGVHTCDPSFTKPTFGIKNWKEWGKWKIAKMSAGRIGFGYTPAEVEGWKHREKEMKEKGRESLYAQRQLGTTLSGLYSLRPQTLAFSLCDSPVGLLAALLDIIHTRAPHTSTSSPVPSRSRSPFLDPGELEMQEHYGGQGEDRSSAMERGDEPFSPLESEFNARAYTWSPTEVLNWVMIQWLPGPEASLRWLRRAHLDTGPDSPLSTAYCPVPLGMSSFRARKSSAEASPLMFGATTWRIEWVKRHQRPATLPAWEAPDLLVLDMRECFGTFLSRGLITVSS